jgi:hypothetical protein
LIQTESRPSVIANIEKKLREETVFIILKAWQNPVNASTRINALRGVIQPG